MKAILIDDEKPALIQMERLLRADGRMEVAGMYTQARHGLEHMTAEKADIVFLDIEMPEMNGLEAAENLYRLNPEAQIVYVTAYNDYAIEAFELGAIDYLLKPVDPERFAKTVSRLESRLSQLQAVRREAAPAGEPSVLCFKQLSLAGGPGTGGSLRWRTQKAQELFAFLVHHRSKRVSKDVILETLWPELSLDKAVTQLHTSVYQVRKMLKAWGIGAGIDYSHDSYRFTGDGFRTDVDLFLTAASAGEITSREQWWRLDQALQLYRGDYLEEHDYFWAKSYRAQLLGQYIQASLLATAYEVSAGQTHSALRRLELLQKKEPFSEEICRAGMEVHAGLGDKLSLKKHYEAFASALREELGSEPGRETTNLYRHLMQSI
ncbi:response regulator [Paenibacillus chitinolyticus]|uniref:response regulator n=1 Tax=Paenibacillus chitinolyticus TaxID=79263 RepID=UPI003CFD3FCF